jgi:hypothetical protein
MKRIAIVGIILAIILAVDGIYMVATQYNGGETQAWNLPDGWIIIISAAALLIVSLVALVLSSRSKTQQTVGAEPAAKAEVEAEKG